MEEKKGFVFQVGTPSIMVILLTFVLTVFALLSVRASGNEMNLSKKNGQAVQEYYSADAKASYMLACIDAALHNTDMDYIEQTLVGLEAGKEKELQGLEAVKVQFTPYASFVTGTQGKPIKNGTISYCFPVNDKIDLEVSHAIYSNKTYQIIKWATTKPVSNIQTFDDSGLQLWDGDVTEKR